MSIFAFFSPQKSADVRSIHAFAPNTKAITIDTDLTGYIGANGALIYAVFVKYLQDNYQMCQKSKWWFPYSYSCICRRTGLSIKQVRRTIDNMERFGVLETARMGKNINQRCYRLVPTSMQNGKLSIWSAYYKAQGIPKTEYVEFTQIQFREQDFYKTGEYIQRKKSTPKRRSIPGKGAMPKRAQLCPEGHSPATNLEVDNQPELLAKQDSSRVRVIKEYNINKIGVTSDTDLSLLGESNNSWEGNQNNKKQPPKSRTFVPSQREIQYTEYVLECILENFPNMSQDAQNKIKQSGPKAVRQLANKFGFRTVKEVLNWGLNDPFWKKQIRSLSPLLRPSKSHPEFKTFEMIKMAYEEQAKDPEDTLEEDLESLAKTLEKTPEGVEELIDCVHWFQDEVDEFNENKIVQVRWTHSDMLLKVLKWLHFIESRIIENEFNYDTWDDIVVAYLEYLKRFVLTSPDRPLYAGFFDPKKSTFQNFVAYLEKKHGTEILDL